MNSNKTICFDVDGTLISAVDNSPRYDIINLLLSFERLYFRVFIWSGSGVDYAASVQRRLGLERFGVIVKGSIKPDIAVDDMPDCTLGIINITV